MTLKYFILSLFPWLLLACFQSGGGNQPDASGNTEPPSCGNGELDDGEVCDGELLDGYTCASLSLGTGSLACLPSCQGFDDSDCCAPDCTGRECGPDPVCGSSCGVCGSGDTCNALGECIDSSECQAQCAQLQYTACTCGSADPCNWSGDGTCDDSCAVTFPDDHFDDSSDCGGCTPKSCAQLGVDCGTIDDGCGNTMDCGTCTTSATWVEVGTGSEHSCGIKSDGSVWCWGRNNFSQLGPNAPAFQPALQPRLVAMGDWRGLSVGDNHSCAIDANDRAFCWGLNDRGQLGDGTTVISAAPVQVLYSGFGSEEFVAVAAGGQHSCALHVAGNLWCSGSNSQGQLADGTTNDHATPIWSGANTVAASAGGAHNCILLNTGRIGCVGAGGAGQLGRGNQSSATSIGLVQSVDGFDAVELGDSHSCGIRTDGRLWCWGFNLWGQLGLGHSNSLALPQLVSATLLWQSVSAGDSHTCGIRSTGALYCWGRGNEGQLGAGSTLGANTPQYVGDGWLRVSAGFHHSCGIKTNGTLWCWGENQYGQLGSGSATSSSAPVQVTM